MTRSGYDGTYQGEGAAKEPVMIEPPTREHRKAPEGFVYIDKRLVRKDSPEHVISKAKQLKYYHNRMNARNPTVELVIPEDK
jgi:hypothetical protein